ncbi:IF-2B-domain-containing protein, partial [Gonapodya prolifera JEL478]
QSQKPVPLFSHLPQYEKGTMGTPDLSTIHPAVAQLGVQFSSYAITGGNARCIAMLGAFKLMISDYFVDNPHQSGVALQRQLSSYLTKQIDFLATSRTLATSMRAAIRALKSEISTLGSDIPGSHAKANLIDSIDRFIDTSIYDATRSIVSNALPKIRDGSVIVTFGRSAAVLDLCIEAARQGIRFKVIVVDGRPRMEGRGMLARLASAGVNCGYCLLSGLNYALKMATIVVLGASALLSNGALMSRVGTACVTMAAVEARVPVVVLCETYKFSDNVRLDSFVWNEIGDPDELVETRAGHHSLSPMHHPTVHGKSSEHSLAGWRELEQLKLLNLLYDVTPAKFIAAVVTEMGIIPSTR